jgi:hypothetical protein
MMRRDTSVQTRWLHLDSIADDIVDLGSGQYRAVLEVEGVPFPLLGADRQEVVLAGFASWLQGVGYPLQILVRAVPLDLDGYLDALEGRAREHLSPELLHLLHDHTAFLRALAQERLLLERHIYVVVPTDAGSAPAPWPFARAVGPADADAARQQLTARCDEVRRGLGRCGLPARRLGSTQLAQLWYACWCPERARLQRLRTELTEYATLAVAGHRPPERRSS